MVLPRLSYVYQDIHSIFTDSCKASFTVQCLVTKIIGEAPPRIKKDSYMIKLPDLSVLRINSIVNAMGSDVVGKWRLSAPLLR